MKKIVEAEAKYIAGGNCIVRCQYIVSDIEDLDNYKDYEFPEVDSVAECRKKARELKKHGGRGCLYCATLT